MFTIKDCLNLDVITWTKNLIDKAPDLNRRIEYISVNDLPLDDFIRENEAVLTIGTPYLNDDDLMFEFISGLVRAKASIFFLCTPGDIIVLSERCRKFASDNNLAVYQIPWDVRFADVIESVLATLHSNYEKDLESFKEIQTKLLEAFLGNKDISDAVSIISKELSCNAIITRADNTPIGSSPILPNMVKLSLETDRATYGYLYINADMSKRSIARLNHTLSPLLSLWFYRDEVIETTQRITKDDFIWNLANGNNPNEPDTLHTAEIMNLRLDISYSCIVGRITPNHISDENTKANWIQTYAPGIQEKLIHLAKSLGHKSMVTHKHNLLLIYYENDFTNSKQSINSYLEYVDGTFEKIYPNTSFSWGVSEIKEGPTDYRNYYLHAKLAEELCSYDLYTNKYFFENALIYNIISTLYEDEELIEDTLDILTPILEYENKKNNNIMNTLKTYVITRNVSETARLLNKHRQTIIYQLNRIEELTGMSMSNAEDLFLLETCIRLHVGL